MAVIDYKNNLYIVGNRKPHKLLSNVLSALFHNNDLVILTTNLQVFKNSKLMASNIQQIGHNSFLSTDGEVTGQSHPERIVQISYNFSLSESGTVYFKSIPIFHNCSKINAFED